MDSDMLSTAPLRITVLIENTAHGSGLRGEHGLSFWIECGDRCILFDTGQSDLLARNARLLKIDLARTSAVVLSHGHYDHSGGLSTVLRAAPRVGVILHPDTLRPRFSRHRDGSVHEIGMPRESARSIQQNGVLTFTDRPIEVAPGLFATGPVPRQTGEDTGGEFFLDAECMQTDLIHDDQALYIPTAHGLVILLGCAHAGLINTMIHVRAISGREQICAVIGGMHLLNASDDRLAMTLAAVAEQDVPLLAPAHCTGMRSTAMLWNRFPGRCRTCHVGSRFEFA